MPLLLMFLQLALVKKVNDSVLLGKFIPIWQHTQDLITAIPITAAISPDQVLSPSPAPAWATQEAISNMQQH